MINLIDKIYIENEIQTHPRVKNILLHFQDREQILIDRYDHIFGKVKKPYLQKRKSLNLFIAQKRGTMVKEAPPAYGMEGDPHYYFIHAFNCVYECEYCYLQGYFHSPDLVLFINHEDIINEIHETVQGYSDHQRIWFHAGEFSDSLALTPLTKELELYFDYFSKNKHLYLELRTKSDQIEHLLEQTPCENIITSFSLSPEKNIDYKAPSLSSRLEAIETLYKKGFPIGIHLDPIITIGDFEKQYRDLIEKLEHAISLKDIRYFSLGVVRFPEKFYHQFSKNYPQSHLNKTKLIKDQKNIIRPPRPIRMPLLNKIKSQLIEAGAREEVVYLCME